MADGSGKQGGAGRALQRIRMAEEIAADGSKQVWHTGPGVEVVTRLDASGHAFWQELTLEGRVVQWSRERGLRTGREMKDERATGRHDSAVMHFDPAPALGTLAKALTIAEAMAPSDRYLEHLAGRVRTTLEAGAPSVRDTVTEVKPVTAPPPQPDPSEERTEPGAPAPEGFFARLLLLLGRR